ncbi:S8 family serine peptidase [Actinocorallia longicatena]|uniref:S8 family serine peptidase n=1 Tax=Actinocorallia longicatena TaxID=111803 RepID=A0ABP6Q2K1_9ACTN
MLAFAAAVTSAAALTLPSSSAHAAPPDPKWKATPLTGGTLVQGAKSETGRLAKTDPALLTPGGAAPVNVMVKLDYDAVAAYKGDIAGLPATSPAVTGKPLDPRSAAAKKYDGYIGGVETRFLDALRGRIQGVRVGTSQRLVYGGVALKVPGDRIADVLKLPGVAAVQRDQLAQPLAYDSDEAKFIGAPTVYDQLGGGNGSGKGVLVGVLDSGAWPEHPSYADPGGLPAPAPTTDGSPRPCVFGDNPLTPAADPFACNGKLISGQPFLDTYNAVVGGEVFPDSARDSDGHGTHTSTTSAGGHVDHATPLGIDRGPTHGIAPGAQVAVYKVCGAQGCYQSDTVQAVARAIIDRVRVINFSISGGKDPYSDPVELAFLDAYAAGIFVSASAGNAGPGAATTDHSSPWVTTVAASTQSRTFQSTVTLTGDGVTQTFTGSSVTGGVTTPAPVVLGSAPPYNDVDCLHPAPPGLFAGKIVACRLPVSGRVIRGFNVKQGGAVGMLLYNETLSQTMTDNHWLPTAHLEKPQADTLLAFLGAHPSTTATLGEGTRTTWPGDVMTAFSSRGPAAGDFLKPDVTAPGLQILGGMTPVPDEPALGPPGNLYQVIAGTSMSAPQVAGAAALLFALHPDWTPGQVKSALETTARTSVVKHDRTTPADPFDMGGGRIDLTKAGDPGLTIDETAANYAASAASPNLRIDLNIPSVNATTMPGAITATRTVKNVTNKTLAFTATGTAPGSAKVTVLPPAFTIAPGKTRKLTIAITAIDAPIGQYFGRVDINQVGGPRKLHLPVAYFRKQGIVTVDQTCTPAAIPRTTGTSTCSVLVQNNALAPTKVTAAGNVASNLQITSATGATRIGTQNVVAQADLTARKPDKPTIAPGAGPAGYIPLDAFGITPVPIGDEQALNLNVPAFVFAGKSYTRLGITSDGYSVAGGAEAADVVATPQTLPDPARPNTVMAPFWTDLDGTGAPGILAANLTDGVNSWIVVEWRENLFGTADPRVFQQWIGVNGAEDVSFAYDPGNLPAAPPASYGLTVGAENDEGTGGQQITGPPTTDLVVTSVPGAPGGHLSYTFTLKGVRAGTGDVTTIVSTPLVQGLTTEVDPITVQ